MTKSDFQKVLRGEYCIVHKCKKETVYNYEHQKEDLYCLECLESSKGNMTKREILLEHTISIQNILNMMNLLQDRVTDLEAELSVLKKGKGNSVTIPLMSQQELKEKVDLARDHAEPPTARFMSQQELEDALDDARDDVEPLACIHSNIVPPEKCDKCEPDPFEEWFKRQTDLDAYYDHFEYAEKAWQAGVEWQKAEQQQWVSVDDKEPEPYSRIFAYHPELGVAYYSAYSHLEHSLTHWMPVEFPDPPEEES